MRRIIQTISLTVLLAVIATPAYAKTLSKEEIKAIIVNAAKSNKYRKSKVVKRLTKKFKPNTKTHTSKPSTKQVKKEASRMVREAKKRLLPFVPLPAYNSSAIVLNQKGFKLLKGEPEKRAKTVKKNPLYKL